MNKNTLLVLGIVIVILIVAVGVAFMYRGKPETTTTTVSPTTAPQTPTFKGEVKIRNTITTEPPRSTTNA